MSSRVQLNPFQRLMRGWRSLAPYNGMHVIRLSGAGDLARWTRAVNASLARAGVGRPSIHEGALVSFERAEPTLVARNVSIEALIEDELGAAFAETDVPIRFTYVPESSEAHVLALTYDHWVGDSVSMRMLLGDAFARYENLREEERPPLHFETTSFDQLFGHRIEEGKVLPLPLPPSSSVARATARTSVHVATLGETTARAVRDKARALDVSTHDLLQVTVAKALTAFDRHKGRGLLDGDELRMGTVVDVRASAATSLDRSLGLFLSCYVLPLRNAGVRRVEDLAKETSAFTKAVKSGDATVRRYNIVMQRLAADASTSVAFSTVNVTGSWLDAAIDPSGKSRVLDYFRVAPARDRQAIVVSMTLGRDDITFATVAREDVMSRSELIELMNEIETSLAATPASDPLRRTAQ